MGDASGLRTGRAAAASFASRSPCPWNTPSSLKRQREMSASMDARTAHPSRNHARGPRILLVDDDQGIVAAVKPALAAPHYENTNAADGGEGLAPLEREHPDILLLDLVMPRFGGLDVGRRTR